MLWNSGSAGQPNAAYKIAHAWSKHASKWFDDKPVGGKIPNMMEPVQFLRQFLALRPVSADMDRWVQYWSNRDHAAKNHEVRADFYLPDFRDGDTPLVAAD